MGVDLPNLRRIPAPQGSRGTVAGEGPMETMDWMDVLREAGRQHRRVRIRFEYTGSIDHSTEYEREYEPYKIEDGQVHVYSYYRGGFRTLKLDQIRDVQLRPESFEPRRPVEF
jgi:predicted DNA-binding transcriptional regulator YafY